ncbi:IDEAL domain-containing protein [Neobacillus dielmonensis]|uniref:IDEAL domain-containing protein n=1 Tax=Neobacillus dielmonensis TaxID=1347369 RepID=UPI0005AB4C7B|nr:IDEAL domain-containing protein [Neobacillus dielmonensis]
MINEKYSLEVGDWVKGESRDGAFIHGYIETINTLYGTLKVKVVASDNERNIGKTLEVANRVERLPVSDSIVEGELRDLIDVALATKDQQWFNELSEKLASLTKKSNPDAFSKSVELLFENNPETSEKESERG